ncbi:MAG: hypothetical protein H7146_04730 [Burkholderiaceae bacterium]|nr:hypothetical protein [Microbacteriaceae bacterium]
MTSTPDSPTPTGHTPASGSPRFERTITSRLFAYTTVFIALLGCAIYVPLMILPSTADDRAGAIVGGIAIAVATVAVASFIRIRVSVDARGLRVTSAVFGYPLVRIPLDRIAGVHSDMLRARDWGGWGYRIVPGRSTAIILHAGPGLVVEKTNDRFFAITLDDANAAAAVLQRLRTTTA